MKKLKNATAYLSVGITSILLSTSNILATNINPDLDMDGVSSAVVRFGLLFTSYGGGFMAFFALIALIESFISENPEKRNQHTKLIIVGIVFISLGPILKGFGFLI